ncbi:hypothetical protein F511_07412 [Dorcoceras hygrometricum]|uniref:Uncharacterized protein n=1 Tax=Dorcoceras hygrometricum TaxID=472368 RepID=A0A2Z7BHV3_9LAMI|nr:hypothetical protein F511_07412 [Dorcoceras hygrometricum]
MFTLKAAKGCSIVPRIHKFYLTNRTGHGSTHDQKPAAFVIFSKVVLQLQMVATTRHNDQTQQSRRNDQTQQPDATIQSQAIQSQGAKTKAGRLLTTGTRRNPQNAAFQLNTTSRCSLDWFLNSTASHPVATLKTRSLTKSNDAVTHASIATRSCSSSRNTIPPATGSSIL